MKFNPTKIYTALRHFRLGLPDGIGIEISTACNRRCTYCCASVLNSRQEIISDELFELFVFRLKEAKWKGIVSLVFASELSLVKESEYYVEKIARTGALPHIFTNGRSPVTIQKWIDAGANRIVVTEHEPFTPSQRDAIKDIKDRNPPWRVKLKHLTPETTNDYLHLPVKLGGKPMSKCVFSDAFGYTVHGEAMFCCIDWQHKIKCGNLLDRPILDLWFDAKMQKMRRLVKNGIPATKLCAECLGVKPQPA